MRRVCRKRGCSTILSVYNPSDRCDIHTRERDHMSMRFIENIRGTYRLTREERERWEGGDA